MPAPAARIWPSVASRCGPVWPSASLATTPKKLGATRTVVDARACSSRVPAATVAESVPALVPAAGAFLRFLTRLVLCFLAALCFLCFLAAFVLCFLAGFLWVLAEAAWALGPAAARAVEGPP